ncbi:MAG: four helix bundle protein [Cyclobacteriaceae bacterium]|nr:four helix bundle protein [Cyclobacteriaceae bacterium]
MKNSIHNFRELKVWEKGKNLVVDIYKVTRHFPDEEKFGLINQIRRSAVSIPSNIAEGCGKGSDKELVRYLKISLGSTYELESQFIISKELEFVNEGDFENIYDKLIEIQKMLYGLINSISK